MDISGIKDIGTEISSRSMLFIFDNGIHEEAYLRIGAPFELTEDQAWCCAFELGTNDDNRVFPTLGIDSVQALDLAMKSLPAIIEHWEKSHHGRFHFLDEEGSGF